MPSVEFQGLDNLELNFIGMSESSVNQVLSMLRDNLIREMPENSGALKESVEIIPARNNGGVITGKVTFGKGLPYAMKVLLGNSDTDNFHYFPKVMKFRDWERGPEELRAPDGFFYFRKVRHDIPPNNFLGRALAKLDYRKVRRIFEENVRKAILRGR
jgi:hypothetical protein